MKLNGDVLFNIPARMAARYGFTVIHNIQDMGGYRGACGLAVALSQVCAELEIEPRQLLTAADRWVADSEFHDEQNNRGHRGALKGFIREEWGS